jgi:endonuclease/exonuclease/phosphatase family metal-dependent hydrolase
MRILIASFVFLAACSDARPPEGLRFEVVGRLENSKIREASGLAHSQRQPGVLWIINDSGAKDILHAIDHTGGRLAEVDLKASKNRDWEDLASFRLDDDPYLMVADIGDNDAKRKSRYLYVFKEPRLGKQKTTVDWAIEFKYPNGPRDAEAAAVDVGNERILVLSKRDLPPSLYEVPLRPDEKKVTARWLGTITSLPAPTRQDVEFAPKTKDWHWQPVGMDISDDNRAAVILTYRAVYYYTRRPGQDWYDALNDKPARVSLGNFKNAEAVAFGRDDRVVYVTGENRNSRLLRVDFGVLPEADAPQQVTVMSFNVENLFDNIDDEGKDDKAYLPLASKQNAAHVEACNTIVVDRWRDECLHLDWNDDILEHKLSVLAETIRQVDGGRGADIVALQEVENLAILERLRNEHLGDLGYLPATLIEGTDLRGIDVAFLSRLPLAGEPVLHPLELAEFPDRAGDTRGILQADFALPDGGILTGFSVHFPAPFHPTAMRVAAWQHLAALRQSLPDSHHAFAVGDFNTTSSEDAREEMLNRFARPYWTVAHDVGCEGCPGTHYYARDDAWSFLDMILFSPARGGKTTARIRADSVAIANGNPRQVSASGTPLRFNAKERRGVSDHWPMIATIEVTQKQ